MPLGASAALMVREWFRGQDACWATTPRGRSEHLACPSSAPKLLLDWKTHLLHFLRGVEVERAQTPSSKKNTHTLLTEERQRGSNLHSASVVFHTYQNTFQHQRIWASIPKGQHTHGRAHTCFSFLQRPNWEYSAELFNDSLRDTSFLGQCATCDVCGYCCIAVRSQHQNPGVLVKSLWSPSFCCFVFYGDFQTMKWLYCTAIEYVPGAWNRGLHGSNQSKVRSV